MKRILWVLLLLLFTLPVPAQVDIPFCNPGEQMPDFSRVGYMWGDRKIPKVKVVKKIHPPKDGEDATALIQDAINSMDGPGAILLKSGTYNLASSIVIDKSGIVLIGEGETETIILGTGKERRTLVTIGETLERTLIESKSSKVADSYVPFGAMSLNVEDSSPFAVGDRVIVRRNANKEFIHALRMDCIEQDWNQMGIAVRQWQPEKFVLDFERIICRIDGNTLYFDNPMVISILDCFGGAEVIGCETNRIRECGIEHIGIDSEFDASLTATQKKKRYFSDEQHAWSAIRFKAAEHCWVRNVTVQHIGLYGFVAGIGAKNITFEDCTSLEPVSYLQGSRRYAFCTEGCELCLFTNCKCDKDRHGCITNGATPGPNVYTRCTMTRTFADAGPHNRLGFVPCMIAWKRTTP